MFQIFGGDRYWQIEYRKKSKRKQKDLKLEIEKNEESYSRVASWGGEALCCVWKAEKRGRIKIDRDNFYDTKEELDTQSYHHRATELKQCQNLARRPFLKKTTTFWWWRDRLAADKEKNYLFWLKISINPKNKGQRNLIKDRREIRRSFQAIDWLIYDMFAVQMRFRHNFI